MMETLKNYMTIEWWTLIVAVATLIVSILAYRYARKSDKSSLRGLIASKEAQLKAMESSMSFGIDVLNVAMYGVTAKQWREANPDLKGNIRDYATVNELICLSNMENINAVLINDGIPQGERLVKLNQIAIQQMQVLENHSARNLLK